MNHSIGSKTELPRIAYSIEEVAQMVGLCTKSIRRLVDRGVLKKFDQIRHVRITVESLEAFRRAANEAKYS
jgi:hypothetical protein